MLNHKDIIQKLIGELKGLPQEEINREFIALKAEIDAQVLAPIKNAEETKVENAAEQPKPIENKEEQKPSEEKPETDEERKLRLFGE